MSVAPLQLLKSEFNPDVYVFLDNATDKFVVAAVFAGATGTTPTDKYFAKGAILIHATDGKFYQNTAADGATPTWVEMTNLLPANNTITTAMIQNSAVTTDKIANNSVTGAKIALASQAAGDIMVYDGTDWVRLAKGTDGQVLTMVSGSVAWATPA